MNVNNLPQLCCRCQKLKLAHLGQFRKGHQHSTRVWVCSACLAKPKAVQRRHRPNNETPPEREIRNLLTQLGVMAVAEFKVDKFIYDFAVPKLRLLIELDSRRYHQSKRQRIRDSFKTKVAHNQLWTLRRVVISPNTAIDVERIILEQRQALQC